MEGRFWRSPMTTRRPPKVNTLCLERHVSLSLKPGSPCRFLLDAEGAGDQPSGTSLPSAPGCTT